MRHVIEEMTSIKKFKGNWLSGLCVIWKHGCTERGVTAASCVGSHQRIRREKTYWMNLRSLRMVK